MGLLKTLTNVEQSLTCSDPTLQADLIFPFLNGTCLNQSHLPQFAQHLSPQ